MVFPVEPSLMRQISSQPDFRVTISRWLLKPCNKLYLYRKNALINADNSRLPFVSANFYDRHRHRHRIGGALKSDHHLCDTERCRNVARHRDSRVSSANRSRESNACFSVLRAARSSSLSLFLLRLISRTTDRPIGNASDSLRCNSVDFKSRFIYDFQEHSLNDQMIFGLVVKRRRGTTLPKRRIGSYVACGIDMIETLLSSDRFKPGEGR